MRISGTVKFFNCGKGFGFITPDEGGKDVFVHATAVEAAGMRALNEGDRVSFELEDDRKGSGKQAAQLKTGLIGASSASTAQENPLVERSAGGFFVTARRYLTSASTLAAYQRLTARPALS